MIFWGDTAPHQSVLEQGHWERRAQASSSLYNWTVCVCEERQSKTDCACVCVCVCVRVCGCVSMYVFLCTSAFAASVHSLINSALADHSLNDCIVSVSQCVKLRHQPCGLCDSSLLAFILWLFTWDDWILVAVGGYGPFLALFSRVAGCKVKSRSSA